MNWDLQQVCGWKPTRRKRAMLYGTAGLAEDQGSIDQNDRSLIGTQGNGTAYPLAGAVEMGR
jgi:hypothetical protein